MAFWRNKVSIRYSRIVERSNNISPLKDVLTTCYHVKSGAGGVGVAGGLEKGVERACIVGLLPDESSRGPGVAPESVLRALCSTRFYW